MKTQPFKAQLNFFLSIYCFHKFDFTSIKYLIYKTFSPFGVRHIVIQGQIQHMFIK
jgi:hypothetical protein